MLDAERSPGEGVDSAAKVGLGCALVLVLALIAVVGIAQLREHGILGGGLTAGSKGAARVFASGQLIDIRRRPAPDFTLRGLSGGELRLSAQRGHPVVLNFWASWCPPCRDEAPVMERTWQEYQAKGVQFIGVDVWDTEADAQRFVRDYGITYANVTDPVGQASIAYGLAGTPETYFIDHNGVMVRKWIGPFTPESLKTFLDELLAAPSA